MTFKSHAMSVWSGSASSMVPPVSDYQNVHSFMHNPPSSAWNDPPLLKEKKSKVTKSEMFTLSTVTISLY